MGTDVDQAERHVFAARALEFLYRNRISIAVTTLAFALAGGVFGLMKPGTWCSTAVVEIGFLVPRNPIESPVVARERINGFLAEASRKYSGRLGIEVVNQRSPGTQALSRLITIKVCAESSAVAEAVVSEGVNRFIARHAELSKYDVDALGRERVLYEEEERRVHKELLAKQGTEDPSPSSALADGQMRPRLLAAALLNVLKERNNLAAALSAHRLPKSRFVDGPTAPLPGPSASWIFAIGGALIGMWLSVGVAVLREMRATPASHRLGADVRSNSSPPNPPNREPS